MASSYSVKSFLTSKIGDLQKRSFSCSLFTFSPNACYSAGHNSEESPSLHKLPFREQRCPGVTATGRQKAENILAKQILGPPGDDRNSGRGFIDVIWRIPLKERSPGTRTTHQPPLIRSSKPQCVACRIVFYPFMNQ